MEFTRAEQRIIEILRKLGKTDTKKVLKHYYPKKGSQPASGRVVVTGTIRELVNKTARSRDFRVKKSDRRGPYPVEVWIEEVKK